ncbi:hypothetical protein ACFX2A_007123 [Malus domestica]
MEYGLDNQTNAIERHSGETKEEEANSDTTIKPQSNDGRGHGNPPRDNTIPVREGAKLPMRDYSRCSHMSCLVGRSWNPVPLNKSKGSRCPTNFIDNSI